MTDHTDRGGGLTRGCRRRGLIVFLFLLHIPTQRSLLAFLHKGRVLTLSFALQTHIHLVIGVRFESMQLAVALDIPGKETNA